MKRAIAALPVLIALFAAAGPSHSEPPAKPAESGIREEANVRILQVDALVTDKDGRTVPGLTREDFKLQLGSRVLPVDTFDVTCPAGATAEPENITSPKQVVATIAPGVKRRIILALDYYSLPVTHRPQVLAAAEAMLRAGKPPEEEVMIVALGYGVRVEQRFTSDLRQLVASLHRMGNDITLWAREFAVGASGRQYFDDLTTLMDVAGGHDGAKGIVFFSELQYSGRTSEVWYDDVAMHAAAARAVIYPSFPQSLESTRRFDALARIANQTGGRMPQQAIDITRPYRWAQRDLTCRYTLGVKLAEGESRKPQKLRVLLDEGKGKLRFPEVVRVFSDEEQARSRARAAYVDPGPYDNPLVRAFAFPMRPASAKKWDTLLAVTFPVPAAASGRDLNLGAVVARGGVRVGKYETKLHVETPATGAPSRPVTVFGDAQLEPGQHSMTVVLSEPGGREVVSAETRFTVPPMLDKVLVFRGPAFARIVPGAQTFHTGDGAKKGSKTRVEQLLGADAGFEPLLIDEIDSNEGLLSYWSACIRGEAQFGEGAQVRRRVLDGAGGLVHELPTMPLKLEDRGGGVRCQEMLEKLEAGKLAAGDYRYEVSVLSAAGETISAGTAPLTVK